MLIYSVKNAALPPVRDMRLIFVSLAERDSTVKVTWKRNFA